MSRKPAPFRVWKRGNCWRLRGTHWPQTAYTRIFDTQAEAIDYAYKHWPWWP